MLYDLQQMHMRLQVVDGNRLVVTPYDLSFRKGSEHAVLCSKALDKKEVERFRKVCGCILHSYESLLLDLSLDMHALMGGEPLASWVVCIHTCPPAGIAGSLRQSSTHCRFWSERI